MKRIFTLILALVLVNQSINAQCDPAFNWTNNNGNVTFTGAAAAPDLYHYWYFDDGHAGYGRTVSHSYNNSGTYQVKHIVYDSLQTCRDSLIQSVTVTIVPTCQASFYSYYDSLEYSYGIWCYSNSTYSGSGIQSYSWSLNGIVQPVNNSTFLFSPAAGNNTVCLTIMTNAGCTSASCQTFNVPASCNLNLSFTHTADPTNYRRISFTPSVSQPGFIYRWIFGDGQTSTQAAPVHLYPFAGTFPVKLTIKNLASNCIDTVWQQVIVASGDTCTASYTYTLNNSGLGSFTAHSNMPIASQWWSFYHYATGDSTLIQSNDPVYQFPDTGYYSVCVILTTNTNCTRSYCENIYVHSVNSRNIAIPTYPNPVTTGEVSMNVILGRAGHIDIRVIDMNGNTVYQTRTHGQYGTNIIKVPVERLNRGQYFVEICYGYKILRSIFQKQ